MGITRASLPETVMERFANGRDGNDIVLFCTDLMHLLPAVKTERKGLYGDVIAYVVLALNDSLMLTTHSVTRSSMQDV
jgi:hypothetical protein